MKVILERRTTTTRDIHCIFLREYYDRSIRAEWLRFVHGRTKVTTVPSLSVSLRDTSSYLKNFGNRIRHMAQYATPKNMTPMPTMRYLSFSIHIVSSQIGVQCSSEKGAKDATHK